MFGHFGNSRLAQRAAALTFFVSAVVSAPGSAQISRVHEQFYLPADHNWAFRNNYPGADRLFNAFDYGHAILYETLWTKPGASTSVLENDRYDFITQKLLVNPPHVPLEEGAIEVAYAKIAPEAKMMFDWAHLLHRQIYDVWSDESIPVADKDARVAELVRYYKTRPELAFSSRPKTMELMEGQYYSTEFRQKYPKFNGLIWAYHWLQIGLYEPLVAGRTREERQTGVVAAVSRFRQMLENAPNGMPRMMPMTAAVSSAFAQRYPEASIIFDNLHSMHDVISDILTSPKVPRDKKREEILKAGRAYRDATSFVESEAEWRSMAQEMGVNNMGGVAVGFLPPLPPGDFQRGAVAAGMQHGKGSGMAGMQHGGQQPKPGMPMPGMPMPGMPMPGMPMPGMPMLGMPMPGMPMPGMPTKGGGAMQPAPADSGMVGMAHQPTPAGTPVKDSMPGMQHAGMQGHEMSGTMMMGEMDAGAMKEMHELMMSDPVIQARVLAVPRLKQLMEQMMKSSDTPAKKTARSKSSKSAPKAATATSRKPAAKAPKKPPKKAAPAPKKAAPAPKMPAGHDMGKMKM